MVFLSYPWTPTTHGKMKILKPQYMGEISPKNEGCNRGFPMVMITLPKTNSSHLKMMVSKLGISKLPGGPPFSGANLLFRFREGFHWWFWCPVGFGFLSILEPRWSRLQRLKSRMFHSSIPISSMYGIFAYIWLIFMGNVGKYTIHGSSGIHLYYGFPHVSFNFSMGFQEVQGYKLSDSLRLGDQERQGGFPHPLWVFPSFLVPSGKLTWLAGKSPFWRGNTSSNDGPFSIANYYVSLPEGICHCSKCQLLKHFGVHCFKF